MRSPTQALPLEPLSQDTAFQAFFRQHLEPLVAPTERLRRSGNAERNRRLKAALIVWLAAAALVLFATPPKTEAVLTASVFLLLVCAGLLGVWAWWPSVGRGNRLSTLFFPRVVPFFGDLEVDPHVNLDLGRYRAWSVVPRFDSRVANDALRGSYRGVPLLIANVTLQKHSHVHSTSANRYRSTVAPFFRGFLCVLSLAQRCRGTTLFGSAGMFREDFAQDPKGPLRPLALGGSAFDVFSDDEAAARELLASRMLGALIQVQELFEAPMLTGSFHADRLVLLIESERELFDFTQDQDTDLVRDAERVRDRLQQVFAMVDALGLEGKLAPGETVVRGRAPADELGLDAERIEAEQRRLFSATGWGWLLAFGGLVAIAVGGSWPLRGLVPAGVELPVAAGAALALGVAALRGRRAIRSPRQRARRGKRRR